LWSLRYYPFFTGYIIYTSKIVALTIGADTKWVDNVLSHYGLAGVEQGRRGVERRLNDDALLALALCRVLAKELGVPVAAAIRIAERVVSGRSTSDIHEIAPGVQLQFSLAEIERGLRDRLHDSVESVAHVRRGRPRK
jgi:hypothetical protein